MNSLTRHEILTAIAAKTENVQKACKIALAAGTENGAIGAMATVHQDLIDLKTLADALVALR